MCTMNDVLHLIDRFFVLSHVVAGFTALVVAPLAMLTAKGGTWHRRWGKVYFWGMAWIFVSTLGLAFFRFNPFLFIINIMSFYAAITGYRVLYRKRPNAAHQQAAPIDWVASSIATVAGLSFVGWGAGGLAGLRLSALLWGDVPISFYILGVIAGMLITRNGISDLRSYRLQPSTRNWWWFEHMTRFLGAYIATVTAFLVQNVSRHLPIEFSWVVWVLQSGIGTILISRWVQHYRQKFAARVTSPSAMVVQSSAN